MSLEDGDAGARLYIPNADGVVAGSAGQEGAVVADERDAFDVLPMALESLVQGVRNHEAVVIVEKGRYFGSDLWPIFCLLDLVDDGLLDELQQAIRRKVRYFW